VGWHCSFCQPAGSFEQHFGKDLRSAATILTRRNEKQLTASLGTFSNYSSVSDYS
jgi:hypothetical protein